MNLPAIERRSDPRRGVPMRVGLALTATGIASAAIDRRSLAGAVPDVPMAVGFGLFVAIVLLATLRRPPRGTTWLAFASFGIIYLLAAAELADSLLGMTSYLLFALGATLVTVPQLRPLMVAAFALWTPALWLFGPTVALEQLPAALRVAAVAALAFTVIAIADPRRAHPSERLRHIGYGLLAIACVAASIGRSLVVQSISVTPGQLMALMAAIGLPLLSYLRMRPASREILATGLALATLAFVGLAYIVGKPYHADVVAAVHRAAELFVSGQNPYAVFDLPEALARFHLDPELATHLESGAVVHTYNYPAVSFLVVAPFVWLGVDDIRWVYLGEVLLLAVIAIQQLRPAWRAMALCTVIGSEIITRQWILAGIDPAWALLTMSAWLVRRHRWWSSILLGLAIAARQPAWFVAPFFLLAILERFGRREAARAAAIALGTAVLVNLPFIIGAPERAIGGMLAPIFAPLVSDGVGLMRYGAEGVVPLFSRTFYTAVSLGAVVGLLVLLWRRPQSLAGAPLAWPFLPLYFAWRSLQNYFASAPLFALIADDELENEAPLATPPAEPERVPRT
ncbi:MAG TPA: glycosyltransferase 87 family protein [Methylomirabilota bacterium]|nr:glycosyltransferase 87 family protein [Methylomirabilota bacterium]